MSRGPQSRPTARLDVGVGDPVQDLDRALDRGEIVLGQLFDRLTCQPSRGSRDNDLWLWQLVVVGREPELSPHARQDRSILLAIGELL